jgi:long-chain fatty acid transport protein
MKLSNLALAILAAGVAGQAAAAGFALNEQSVSAMGTGNAGRASYAQDASVVYNNPAAMMELKQAEVSGSLAFIDAKSKITAAPGLPGSNQGDMVPFTTVPSGYYTSGNKGNYAWGIASYGSYGLKTNYEPSFAGRPYGLSSSLRVITIQPAIAFKITDKVSFGFGPTFNRIDAKLTKDLSTTAPNPASALGTVQVKGDEIAYGFNAGLHAELSKSTQVGLVYRSQQSYNIKDGTFISSNPAIGFASASTKVTLPQSVDLGLSHRLDEKTQLHAGVEWTRWSRLQQLAVATNSLIVGTTAEQFHWKDSTAYTVGVTHDCTDKLQLRGGLSYDASPVTEKNAGVRVPSGDRFVTSIGAGYKLNKAQSVDVSYSYLKEQSYQVNQPGYQAKFENSANIFAVQFNQKF